MAGSKIENIILGYATPIMEQNNYELVDIEFQKEGSNWYLRIYADKENGFTLDDCELVSRALSKVLEEKDPIEQPYILEVSSPGLDRPLKKDQDFVKFAGSVVDVKLYQKVNNTKQFQGVLKGLSNNVVTIIDEGENEINFKREDIANIRLAVIF
jgi:ribosome maturation factor RimP